MCTAFLPCSVVGAAVLGALAIVAAVVVYRKVSQGGVQYQRCEPTTKLYSFAMLTLARDGIMSRA